MKFLINNIKINANLKDKDAKYVEQVAASGFQLVVAAAGNWLGANPVWRPSRPLLLTEGVSSRERGKRAGQDGPVLLHPPSHQHQQQQQQQ